MTERSEIVTGLAARRAADQAVVGTAAGIGLVARSAEAADADYISVQVTGLSRHLGVPTTTTLGNATTLTMQAFAEIENVVERTPIVGGIEATDGTRRRLDRTLDQYLDLGFDGISNFPTVGTMLTWAEVRRSVGEGIDREFELIRLARERDVFTVAHAYTAEHARELAAAGADVVVARCGPTTGGFVGPPEGATQLEASLERVQAISEAVRDASLEALVLVHGGPFATAQALESLYDNADVDGVHGESATERLPIESGVSEQVAAVKQQTLRTHL
jgi:predicted TIM-barrel enzyme